MMKLTTTKNGTDLTVRLSGELNTLTSPDLSSLLGKELAGTKTLTLDFADCNYISSTGLRVLLVALKQMQAVKGSMRLINVGESVMDILHCTGMDILFGMDTY